MGDKKKAVLGIDNGTQGLTALLVDIDDPTLPVIATGEGSYGFVPNLASGCYEQQASDWDVALKTAIQQVMAHPAFLNYQIVAMGVAGQMHGHVLVDSGGKAIGTVRLWCDARNQAEAEELSELFYGRPDNLPKRVTAARWLWTMRNQPELAESVDFLTTPAGWLSFRLTNSKRLGIGDSSGMFPMGTKNYRQDLLQKFQERYGSEKVRPLSELLPEVVLCGDDAGNLTAEAVSWLGLPKETIGIPLAAAEGDQPATLVGSLIGHAGMASLSFGTSVCANLVGGSSEDPAMIISPGVNHFSAVNGQPIYMVWLRNGTTYFNTVVKSYGSASAAIDHEDRNAFDSLMPQILDAPADCGGLLAMPFMDDEPGLGVTLGGTATLIGWNPNNAIPGNVCKAALLSTMFNLKKGVDYLKQNRVSVSEIFLSGGLTKTPEMGQVVADVFELPVHLLPGSEEGCSWGAAVLAKYRWQKKSNPADQQDWPDFLKSIATKQMQSFSPYPPDSAIYQTSYRKYDQLLKLQPELQQLMNSSC
ncbi:sugar kinase [Nitzschia inconspicua]|uniref:Sugar kinase n=1 Tax=Nitzschia inconspicua TaxID=303405 RepID=A0A9K3KRL4_9STRA|nr:sugar kinase [Nitzschia inconspicua]